MQEVKREAYHNQERLVTGTKGWFSIWKSIYVIHHINRKKKRNKEEKSHELIK
jgi:hypothetical protein